MVRSCLLSLSFAFSSAVLMLACSDSTPGLASSADPSEPRPGHDLGSSGDGSSGDASPREGSPADGLPVDGTPDGRDDRDAARPAAARDAGHARDGGDALGLDAATPRSDAATRLPDAGAHTSDAGRAADAGGAPEPAPIVRFIVFGDGGTGEAGQHKVAGVVQRICALRGCEFALYLGDNIYDDGVTGADDVQFQDKFETPYAALDFPFYLALGNHDYGSGGSNLFPEDARSAAQVEYTAYSEKWNLPHYYYSFRQGPVAFFVIDTNAILLDDFRPADEQKAWLDRELAASDARWKIVLGHHTYLSNGEHGNAGNYEGLGGIPFFERYNGTHMKNFIEASVCGRAQVYFAGHDHHREWLEPACGTNFVISGAAAQLRTIVNRTPATPARWNDASKLGFLWVEIAGDQLTGVFYDEDGAINYEDVIAR